MKKGNSNLTAAQKAELDALLGGDMPEGIQIQHNGFTGAEGLERRAARPFFSSDKKAVDPAP